MPWRGDRRHCNFAYLNFGALQIRKDFPYASFRNRYAPGISDGEGGEPPLFGVMVSANSLPPSRRYVTLTLSPGFRFSAPLVLFVNKTVSVPLSVFRKIKFCSRSIFCTVPSNINADAIDI